MKRKIASFPGSKGIFYPQVSSYTANISHLTSKNWKHEGEGSECETIMFRLQAIMDLNLLKLVIVPVVTLPFIVTYSFFSETHGRNLRYHWLANLHRTQSFQPKISLRKGARNMQNPHPKMRPNPRKQSLSTNWQIIISVCTFKSWNAVYFSSFRKTHFGFLLFVFLSHFSVKCHFPLLVF